MKQAIRAAAVLLALGAAVGVAWWMGADAEPVTVDEIGDENQTVAPGTLPVFASRGDAARLYAFAVDNKDTLAWIPCTCGCGRLGHTSNRSCYVKDERASRVTFTSHAAT